MPSTLQSCLEHQCKGLKKRTKRFQTHVWIKSLQSTKQFLEMEYMLRRDKRNLKVVKDQSAHLHLILESISDMRWARLWWCAYTSLFDSPDTYTVWKKSVVQFKNAFIANFGISGIHTGELVSKCLKAKASQFHRVGGEKHLWNTFCNKNENWVLQSCKTSEENWQGQRHRFNVQVQGGANKWTKMILSSSIYVTGMLSGKSFELEYWN